MKGINPNDFDIDAVIKYVKKKSKKKSKPDKKGKLSKKKPKSKNQSENDIKQQGSDTAEHNTDITIIDTGTKVTIDIM